MPSRFGPRHCGQSEPAATDLTTGRAEKDTQIAAIAISNRDFTKFSSLTLEISIDLIFTGLHSYAPGE
jgi:hypothetical protein